MNEIEILNAEKSFQEGKRYFHYGNYPYLFKFVLDSEKKIIELENSNEILICACFRSDLEDLYQIVYSLKKNGYYLINGNIKNTEEELKEPIKLGSSLSEIFQCENYAEKLIDANNEEYLNFMAISFHENESEISTTVPKSIFPNIDLRLFFKEIYPEGYFSDHKEFNATKFNVFAERTNLKEYAELNSFYESRPNYWTNMKFINKVNTNAKENKLLYVEFYQSGYQGIVQVIDLSDETLTLFLKYGIIYNKSDIPQRIYELLK